MNSCVSSIYRIAVHFREKQEEGSDVKNRVIPKSAIKVTTAEGKGLVFFWIMKCEQPVFERPAQKSGK